MENIVFIVGSYYPTFSAVGKCQYYLASELVKRGYNVHIISITNDNTLARKEIYKGQNLYRIYIKQRGSLSNLICRGIKRLSLDLLDRGLVNLYYEVLDRINVKPDLIIPTCLPFESIFASVEYKKEIR